MTKESTVLPRVLSPFTALCVVVGSVIGSGIFLVPATVARSVPFMGGIILVWIVGGLFSAAGALTVAELGATLPHAGGPYVYLRAAYGRLPAFLFGWTEFLILRAGSMATLAAAFARYFAQLVPSPAGIRLELWQMVAAVGAIAFVTAVNVVGTGLGGRLQVAGTFIKVGGVATLMMLPFLSGGASVDRLSPVWPTVFKGSIFKGMMAAMVGVLWAYDGWINLASLGEEVHEPERSIPRALGLGMAILISVYVGMTLCYHLVLPFPEITSASGSEGIRKAVAASYCRTLLGQTGVRAISILVMISTFISLNGNALTGPRAYFAMARDGLFPTTLCRINHRFRTPANAVIAQGAWAIALTVVGTLLIVAPAPPSDGGLPSWVVAAWTKLNHTPLYDVLFTYVIFGAIVFNLLTITSVFVLRRTMPDAPRSYHTLGYPFTPLLFVAASLLLMGNMLADSQSRIESLAGVGIILMGLPAYAFFSRQRNSPPVE